MADANHYYYGLGRRKSAIATTRLYAGKGEISVNDQTAAVYFNNPTLVAKFGPAHVARLLGNPGIVRNRLKIASTVGNAKAFVALSTGHVVLEELDTTAAPFILPWLTQMATGDPTWANEQH